MQANGRQNTLDRHQGETSKDSKQDSNAIMQTRPQNQRRSLSKGMKKGADWGQKNGLDSGLPNINTGGAIDTDEAGKKSK